MDFSRLKVIGAKPFQGVITDYSDLRPSYGGKPFILEATLDDGSKVYLYDYVAYQQWGFPRNFTPYKVGGMEEAFIDRKCLGEYWENEGKKIIVSFRFFGD